jgi:hypothetical protein
VYGDRAARAMCRPDQLGKLVEAGEPDIVEQKLDGPQG